MGILDGRFQIIHAKVSRSRPHAILSASQAVSYTHLDVYKRQPFKAFIDRTQQLFVRRVLFKREKIANNKKGILICTCGGCDLSAVESLKAPAEMFFSVFGATLSETVYLAGTDLPPEKRRCNRIKLIEKEMSK